MSTIGEYPYRGPHGGQRQGAPGAIRRLHRRRAFTLVEIVVVLVIIAVLLTMASVSLMGAVGGVAVQESATRLWMTLRQVRAYAVLHGCVCRVTFSPQSGTYEMTCQAEPGREDSYIPMPGGRYAHLEKNVRFTSVAIEPRAGATVDGYVLTYQPGGESDGARIGVGDGRRDYTLIVAPASGLARLLKGAVDVVPQDREDLG